MLQLTYIEFLSLQHIKENLLIPDGGFPRTPPKLEGLGPGIQSFEAVNMYFGYFGQHTSFMKKNYWYFLIPPSGQASGSIRCWKMQS